MEKRVRIWLNRAVIVMLTLFVVSFTKMEIKADNIPDLHAEVTYDNVMAILNQYDSDGAFVVGAEGSDALWVWENGGYISGHLGECVHESSHVYSMRNSTEDTKVIVAPNGKVFYIPRTEYFVTNEMTEGLPSVLRDGVYDMYLNENLRPNAGSIVDGIYGLMDEFAAYELGFHDEVIMYDYYSSKDYAQSAWVDYVSTCISDRSTFLKFKYYILFYFDYAKNNYPSIYEQLITNKTLMEAINYIDAAYKKDAQSFMKKLPKTIEILQKNGELYARDTWTSWYYTKGMAIGKQTKNYLDVIDLLATDAMADMEKVLGTSTVCLVDRSPEENMKEKGVSFSSGSDSVTAKSTSKGVELSWPDYGTDTDGFWIERKSGSSGYVFLANVSKDKRSYLDKKAVTGETYYYRVIPYGYYETSLAYGGDIYMDGWFQLNEDNPVKITYKKVSLKEQTIQVNKIARKKINYKASELKKKKASFSIGATAKGKIMYKIASGSSKNIEVSSKGKVTLKKGCKKGTYKILVTAAATKQYKKAEKVVTVIVK